VKAEFAKFGEVIAKVEKKLSEASTQLHNVGVRNRAIERTLRDVEALPPAEGQRMLPEISIAERADEVEAV
jgi:DNA recombination protein RmuC